MSDERNEQLSDALGAIEWTDANDASEALATIEQTLHELAAVQQLRRTRLRLIQGGNDG